MLQEDFFKNNFEKIVLLYTKRNDPKEKLKWMIQGRKSTISEDVRGDGIKRTIEAWPTIT